MGKLNKTLSKSKSDYRKQRRKNRGEIFTPTELAEKMVNLYPVEDLKDPTKTYLDPCCGATNVFPILLMFKLANGLREAIPNVSERIHNILEKQLHMAEIDEDACDYAIELITRYAKCLEFCLSSEDTDEVVNDIKKNYCDAYDELIEEFYRRCEEKYSITN